MHVPHRTRLALVVVAATAFALPVAAIAAEPGPPAAVAAWGTHMAHMQSMDAPLGSHVEDCIATHGSMAGQFGPNGAMVEMMGEMMR